MAVLVAVAGMSVVSKRLDDDGHSLPVGSRAIEIAIGPSSSPLPGTLLVPSGEGPFPVVVLVPGSGPNDRDETVGWLKPFRDIAEGLARHGVASYRYDKRSKVHPRDLAGSITVDDEYVTDAVAAIQMLERRSEVDPDRIVLLGHSQGGTVAPRIAERVPEVAGVVLFAASTEPLEQAIVRQARFLAELRTGTSPEGDAAIEALQAQAASVESPDLTLDTPASKLFGIPASYWLDLRGYDPAAAAAALPQPLLVLQGGHDYQVTQTSFDAFRAALAMRADVTFHLYPELTHVFIDGDLSPAVYRGKGHVAAEVIDDIAAWVDAL
jgi:dienelactone hydrolase